MVRGIFLEQNTKSILRTLSCLWPNARPFVWEDGSERVAGAVETGVAELMRR